MSSSEVLSAVKDYIFKKVSNSLEKKMEEFVKKLIIDNGDYVHNNVEKGINEINAVSGDTILKQSKIPMPYDMWTDILNKADYDDKDHYYKMRDIYNKTKNIPVIGQTNPVNNQTNPVIDQTKPTTGGNKKRVSKKRRKMGKKTTRKQRGGNLDTLASALQTIATVYEDKNKPIDFDVISEPILDFIKKTVEKKREIITISLNSIADATTPNSFQQILKNEIEDKIEEVVIEDINKQNNVGNDVSNDMKGLEKFITDQHLLLLVEGKNEKKINDYYIEKENANTNASANANASASANASEKGNETRDATPVINKVHSEMNYDDAEVFVNSFEKFKTQFKNQVKELFNNHYKAFQTANANPNENDDKLMELVHYDFGSNYNMPYNKLATELTLDPSFNDFMNKQCSSAPKKESSDTQNKSFNPFTQKKDQIICNGNNLIEKFITYKYKTNKSEPGIKLRLLERVYNYSIHRQYSYNTNGDLLDALNNAYVKDNKFRKDTNVVGKSLLKESIRNPRGAYQLFKLARAFDSPASGKGY